MTSLVPENWREEADKWDENGDPAHDPEIELEVAEDELNKKRVLYGELAAKSDAVFAAMFEEAFGFPPPRHSEITVYLIISAIIAKYGKEGWEVIKEYLKQMKTSTGPKVLPGGKVIWPGPKGLPTLGRTVVKRIVIVDIIIALIGSGLVVAHRLEYQELIDALRILDRAMRFEALQVDPTVDNGTTTVFINPSPKDLEHVQHPKCKLVAELIIRWIDPETGQRREIEEGEKELRPNAANPNEYESEEIEIPSNACFLETFVTIWLVCNTTPPSREKKAEYKTPVRTSIDCEKHRGRLPIEVDLGW